MSAQADNPANETPRAEQRYLRPRLFTSFLIFGLLNNGTSPHHVSPFRADYPVLYVIILSAALDLVGGDTPKGVVAFFNIFPALLAKVAWPLISNGTIRYTRRVGFCTIVSWLGIVVSPMIRLGGRGEKGGLFSDIS